MSELVSESMDKAESMDRATVRMRPTSASEEEA